MTLPWFNNVWVCSLSSITGFKIKGRTIKGMENHLIHNFAHLRTEINPETAPFGITLRDSWRPARSKEIATTLSVFYCRLIVSSWGMHFLRHRKWVAQRLRPFLGSKSAQSRLEKSVRAHPKWGRKSRTDGEGWEKMDETSVQNIDDRFILC